MNPVNMVPIQFEDQTQMIDLGKLSNKYRIPTQYLVFKNSFLQDQV